MGDQVFIDFMGPSCSRMNISNKFCSSLYLLYMYILNSFEIIPKYDSPVNL